MSRSDVVRDQVDAQVVLLAGDGRAGSVTASASSTSSGIFLRAAPAFEQRRRAQALLQLRGEFRAPCARERRCFASLPRAVFGSGRLR
jgi:hypothetical protein